MGTYDALDAIATSYRQQPNPIALDNLVSLLAQGEVSRISSQNWQNFQKVSR